MSHRLSPDIMSRETTVAICGNPNCGKTTLFNALTGLSQRVGNYPGVTVERTIGAFEVPGQIVRRFNLVDTPGSYSLSAFSPDEYIATRVLSGDIEGDARPDIILCVIDATNLERGLYLLFQVVKVGRPVVVALNMMDLAERHGTRIDTTRLGQLLPGIPIVPVVASREQGIDRLKAVIASIIPEQTPLPLNAYDEVVLRVASRLREVATDGNRTEAQWIRVLFDRGGPAEKSFLSAEGDGKRSVLEGYRSEVTARFGALSVGETRPLTERASQIAHEVISEAAVVRLTRSERVDRFLLHPLLGPLILLAVMVFMFQSVFSWAEPAMNLIDSQFGALGAYVSGLMADGPIRSLLVDGVIGGVGSVLVFLPQIIILFLFIAILEDSGYMPRAAFLVDRLFGWCGLSGKSFVPLLSSFACAVPGIMATRTIENRKLRIMTILVAPLMSCSARLPVYAIMIAAFIPHEAYLGIFNSRGLVLTGLYALGMVTAIIVAFILNRVIYHQERATFMMAMPSYTIPTPRSILIRITNRVKSFLERAGTVILAITIVIWALSYYPRSEALTPAFEARAETVRQVYATQGQAGSAAEQAELAALKDEQAGAYIRNSYFGRAGRLVAPAFEPLGWDWKITMATLASFPAREVIIATLGTIYNLGTEQDETSSPLTEKMRQARWESGPREGMPVFGPAVALSVMVFFALCAQCGATLVTIRHETGRWRYPVIAFVYMTGLAYLAAMATYQLFSRAGL
ncbi:MAG: ferrous iron transport protein B [Candidatus Zixiibacteriota bacterium]